eukprot:10855123-Alexandrium_andersonii.AAC.1
MQGLRCLRGASVGRDRWRQSTPSPTPARHCRREAPAARAARCPPWASRAPAFRCLLRSSRSQVPRCFCGAPAGRGASLNTCQHL